MFLAASRDFTDFVWMAEIKAFLHRNGGRPRHRPRRHVLPIITGGTSAHHLPNPLQTEGLKVNSRAQSRQRCLRSVAINPHPDRGVGRYGTSARSTPRRGAKPAVVSSIADTGQRANRRQVARLGRAPIGSSSTGGLAIRRPTSQVPTCAASKNSVHTMPPRLGGARQMTC